MIGRNLRRRTRPMGPASRLRRSIVAFLIGLVRLDPFAVALGFAQRLGDIGAEDARAVRPGPPGSSCSSSSTRPDAEERLHEHVLVVGVGRPRSRRLPLSRRPEPAPRGPATRRARAGGRVHPRHAWCHASPTSVSACGQACARSLLGVEFRQRDAEPAGLAADLVERQEPDIAIEQRILEALGHDRAGQLLEPRRKRSTSAGEARPGRPVGIVPSSTDPMKSWTERSGRAVIALASFTHLGQEDTRSSRFEQCGA